MNATVIVSLAEEMCCLHRSSAGALQASTTPTAVEVSALADTREVKKLRVRSSPADTAKRASDITLALLLSILALPVILIVWAIVRATSAGPGFYFQRRMGLGGRPFWICKIRTMTHNCEAVDGAKWSTAGDTRVTGVGRILRRLHLDELPQLANVLKGDMSLVGPRPERPEFSVSLAKALPGYDLRTSVRPGVTGLAQIQLPADSDLESVRRKLALDLCYLDHRSAWLDARILFGTIIYLAGLPYSRVRQILSLPSAGTNEVSLLSPISGHLSSGAAIPT